VGQWRTGGMVKEELEAAVRRLQASVGALEEQLEKMRLRVASLERTISSVVEMDYPAFRAAAREAYERLNQQNRGFVGVVPISDLRRAIGPRVTRATFDENLVKMQRDGAVQLMPHPGSISEERLKEGLQHPTLGALYFVRWEHQP